LRHRWGWAASPWGRSIAEAAAALDRRIAVVAAGIAEAD